MTSTRARLVVAILLSLMFALPASATERPVLDRFMGIRLMPGGIVTDGKIVYQGGDVVVVPGIDIETFDSCPSGWVCLFADATWQGDMLQFNTCCAWNNLSAFGFNNIASSWRNRMSVDAQIAKETGGGGAILCLNNGSYSSTMPSGWDNAASSIRVRSSSTIC